MSIERRVKQLEKYSSAGQKPYTYIVQDCAGETYREALKRTGVIEKDFEKVIFVCFD